MSAAGSQAAGHLRLRAGLPGRPVGPPRRYIVSPARAVFLQRLPAPVGSRHLRLSYGLAGDARYEVPKTTEIQWHQPGSSHETPKHTVRLMLRTLHRLGLQ